MSFYWFSDTQWQVQVWGGNSASGAKCAGAGHMWVRLSRTSAGRECERFIKFLWGEVDLNFFGQKWAKIFNPHRT